MKNRKELPNFGYLSDKKIDIDAVIKHLYTNNILDSHVYNDIKVSTNSKHKNFVVANEFSKNNFFKEEGAERLEGEKYVQLYLTDFDESKSTHNNIEVQKTTIFSRTRRLNPNNSNYLPEADELNYGVRNSLVKGIFEDILNMFQSKITRVRLAYLKSNFSIKPHVDYDPSYIVRYHIPIITNIDCSMHIINNKQEYKTHFPADGKIYFFNAGHKHWASNTSNSDRLHLIVDVHGQTELDNLVTL